MRTSTRMWTRRTLGAGLVAAVALAGGVATAAIGPQAAHGARLAPVIDGYLAAHAGLFADDLAAVHKAAKALATAAKGQADIAKAARSMAGATDLKAARVAFGEASKALLTVLAAHPAAAAGLHAFRCPMTKTYKKWLDRQDKVRNPYMGQRMPHCGTHTDLTP